MKNEIALLIDKSKRSIKAAKQMISDGHYDFSINRSYYAIFYISEAFLFSKGKIFSKHTAVISAIYEYFIKTKVLDKRFHKVFHRAFDLRQQSDYLNSPMITQEIAEDLLQEVTKEIKLAAQILSFQKLV